MATAAVLLVLLAVVRIAGAFHPALMVASIAITPMVVIAVPPSQYRQVGLCRVSSPKALLAGLVAVLLSYAASVGACVLLFGTGPDNWARGMRTIFDTAVADDATGRRAMLGIYVLICLGILIPAAEEVCYRGVLHTAAASRLGSGAAVVATSIAWAVVHLGDYGLQPVNARVIVGVLPSIFLMGLALGWSRVITRSVVSATLGQGIANVVLAVWVLHW